MIDSHFGLSVVTPPTAEPLTAAEMKAQSRIDHDADLPLIEAYIAAARGYIEQVTGLQLVTATWRLSFDRFPCQRIELPKSPLQSVAQIQYVDEEDALATLDPSLYQVDAFSLVGRVAPVAGEVWPVTAVDTLNAVRIDFVAGFGSPSQVPQQARQAVRLLAAHLYENREPLSPVGMFAVPKSLDTFVRSLWTGIYR